MMLIRSHLHGLVTGIHSIVVALVSTSTTGGIEYSWGRVGYS